MALSGTITTNSYDGRYYEFKWSATQSIANNKTSVSYEISAKGGNSAWYAERTLHVEVSGLVLIDKTDRVQRYTGVIKSGTFDCTHNSSGNYTMTISMKAAVYDATVNLTASKSVALDTIPRQATLTSAQSFTDTQNPIIKYSNPAGSAVSALDACISFSSDGSTTPAISYRAVTKTGSSYTFSLTTAEKNTLINNTSGNSRTVYFHLRTKVGGNTYYSTLAKTFSISDTSISFDSYVYDTNSRTKALTGNSFYIVKGYSDLYYLAGASAANGTISSVTATCGGATKTGAYGTFPGAQSATVTFTAKDSRGNTATHTDSATLINYFKPTLNVDVTPVSTNGELTIRVSGTFFNGSFGKVMNTLTSRYSISHEGSGFSSGSAFDLSISGNSYSGQVTLTGLDYKNVYIVSVNAYDELEELQPGAQKAIGKPLFDWDNEEFNFNTDVRITGDLRLKGDGNYGNTIYFGDSSYAYVSEATDDALTFNASKLYLNGSSTVQINGAKIETGTWTPKLAMATAVSSYTTQSGWYIRMGKVVTIGWNIDATCNSGYSGNAIKISGAPFPAVTAAGGGILYGAYVTGGLAFEGWVIESDTGAITPRLQPCNNTSAGNLNISSTAYYPNGGGSLKCFGTITYTTY